MEGIVPVRQTLAVIADIATILGVSIAWFIGTPWVGRLLGRSFSLFDLITGVLFYFVVICITLFFSAWFLSGAVTRFKARNYVNFAVCLFAYLVVLSAIIGIFGPFRSLWANVFGNTYLRPAAPVEIVQDLDLHYNRERAILHGRVTWKPGFRVELDEYRAVAYLKYSNDSPFYVLHSFTIPTGSGFTFGAKLVKISADGSFIIPGISTNSHTVGNVLEGCLIAIITRLDGEPLVARYPGSVTDERSEEFSRINAYAKASEVAIAQQ